MDNKLDYQLVPLYYAHCFNAQCVKSNQCLRYMAATSCTSQAPFLSIVNPYRIPADTSMCPFFQSSQKERHAWGVKHIFDNLPHKKAQIMRKQIIAHFGKNAYYRFYREENMLSPQDQVFIQKVFTQHGIKEEPNFDRYTYEYVFRPTRNFKASLTGKKVSKGRN